MDISKINDITSNSSVDSVKNKVADDSFEKKLQGAMDNKDDKELKKVCKDFEAIMMGMMFKEMKATVQKSEFIPEDTGTKIFDSMFDDKLVEEASQGQSVGLSDILYKQLSKQLNSKTKP